MEQQSYGTCQSSGLVCAGRPCTQKEIELEQKRVNNCIANKLGLQLLNSTVDQPLSKDTRYGNDVDGLPTLPFFGNSETCEVQSLAQDSDHRRNSDDAFGKVGWGLVFFGAFMILIQPFIFYHQYVHHKNCLDDDSNTECCSVASEDDLDEELGLEKTSTADETDISLEGSEELER